MRQICYLATTLPHQSSVAIYEQQNLDAKEQFKVFAKGLVRDFCHLSPMQCSQTFHSTKFATKVAQFSMGISFENYLIPSQPGMKLYPIRTLYR